MVTGASGLIGNELVLELIKRYGTKNVIATDLTAPNQYNCRQEALDVTDPAALRAIIKKNKIDTVYHLAGIISAGSEKNPELGWKVNFEGLKHVLEAAREFGTKIFWPSSIAVFGPTTPREKVPQHTVLEPTTIYGIAKVSGELLCQYYFNRYGVDVRSLRYPGIIGWRGKPGDGTTEYAIHIFYAALKDGSYDCFLKANTELPMMYIDDAIRGTIELMEAPAEKIAIRTSYNFAGISFTPEQMAAEINNHTKLTTRYQPDFRQAIAESWPQSIDDSTATAQWGWKARYQLPQLTETMLDRLGQPSSTHA